MSVTVDTVSFSGVEMLKVEVQAYVSGGMPGIVIVGLIDKAIAESKERIRAAISSLGLSLPPKRIVINLAPASMEKEGGHFDLPIVLSLLIAIGVITQESINGFVALGELSLDGRICRSRGVLPTAMYAIDNNKKLICPFDNAMECKIVEDKLEFIAPKNLLGLINHLQGKHICTKPILQYDMLTRNNETTTSSKLNSDQNQNNVLTNVNFIDFAKISGQEIAKRAMIIAACGGHNILLNGHPGTGKSMLASAFPHILPRLSPSETLEVSVLYSLAGLLKELPYVTERPYRSPHHSASTAAIVGGGRAGSFGEITLAHCGVLFLDELPEFQRQVLDSLRQPLEDGFVSIARADYRCKYPAKFQLIAAMNPCKCGYFGDIKRQCRKIPHCAVEYESRVSGPIIDRIDITVDVETENLSNILRENKNLPENTESIRKLVETIRLVQNNRYQNDTNSSILNSNASHEMIEQHCKIDDDCITILEQYANKYGLSMRGYGRTIRVARTIADMANSDNIQKHHLLEALRYRKTIPGYFVSKK